MKDQTSTYYSIDVNSGLLVDTYNQWEHGCEVFLRTRNSIHWVGEDTNYLRELAATLITVANEIEELQKESE